jgi:signal recognition particle receptor subunit beta
MPTIDHGRGVLVVRVVYDGPACSGKTTTLRALAGGLGVAMTTPVEEAGRTLFFDWVEYVGGLFEGRKIRCQIVSVPGQPELAARRRLLLEDADAVVVVADTRAREIDAAYDIVRDVVPRCRAKEPPVGVVLQANKRDAPDSVPRDIIGAELAIIAPGAGAPAAIIETVASRGDGVREAFVFAIRLALDRVRWLASRGRLPEAPPLVDRPEDLLEQLRALGPPATAPVMAPASSRRPPPRTDEVVFVPDPMMPGGFIWPPVEGRTLLHEVARSGLVPALGDDGEWSAARGGWRCHSGAAARFDDADGGRRALIEWARLHASNLSRISSGRALILAEAGGGRFRLWQLVRAEPTCQDRLDVAARASPADLARALCEVALQLLRARELMHGSALEGACSLATVGADQPIFVGLMPPPEERPRALDGGSLLERELAPMLDGARARADYREVRHLVGQSLDRHPSLAPLGRLLEGA